MLEVKKLNSGFDIPIAGLGTYKPKQPGETETAVKDAIDAGFRYFDCAWIYENEAEVGRAIKEKIKEKVILREDVFITTKVWNNFHKRRTVVEMLKKSLKEMKLVYVDLYLIHWPMGFKENAKRIPVTEAALSYSDVDYVETWKGMQDCVSCGYTRSIGLANFNSQQIERIIHHAKLPPAVCQIEVHPEFRQKKLIDFCQNLNIVVTAYCPLGTNETSGVPGFPEHTVNDASIIKIAQKHKKTAAQVVLNYLVSLGICVIPRAVTKIHIEEYFNSFDFKLDKDDLEYLDSCDSNKRTCTSGAFVNHRYYPFHADF